MTYLVHVPNAIKIIQKQDMDRFQYCCKTSLYTTYKKAIVNIIALLGNKKYWTGLKDGWLGRWEKKVLKKSFGKKLSSPVL